MGVPGALAQYFCERQARRRWITIMRSALRLIRHDDGGSVTRLKACILQGTRQRQRRFLEIGISQPRAFGIAIRLDETDFIRPAVESIAQGFARH